MPIFYLDDSKAFPPVEMADENGILAIGGDLSPERLISAYREGIFPWFSENDPIVWWSPDPRFVLFPREIRISRSMKQVLKRKVFDITYDKNFQQVIKECRTPRNPDEGTWITDDMLDAYLELHSRGIAHSVETWCNGVLVGGLYGISLGRCFFGESMFTKMSNASKAALISLTLKLKDLNFLLIDCQVFTQHLKTMGARFIPRKEFININKKGLELESIIGNWNDLASLKSM